MKALLIGGTGTISGEVSRLLIAQGWELYLLNRGNRCHRMPHGAKVLQGDVHDTAAVKELLAGHTFDVVANFIAFTPQDVQRDYELFRETTKQYIFISSASVYQKPVSLYPVTESTPLYNPHWEYSQNKIECENLLQEYYRKEGFPITIVRPSHTYSAPGVPTAIHGKGGTWPVLQRIINGEPVVVHGDGTSLWTLTHARDFAAGFTGLMANPHAVGQAVHITSDEVHSWNQIYTVLGNALGRQPHIVYAPSMALADAGIPFGYNLAGGLLGDKAHCMVFDNSKIKRLVPGFCAVTRLEQGVRESIALLQETPALQTQDPDFDRFCDKVAATMKNLF